MRPLASKLLLLFPACGCGVAFRSTGSAAAALTLLTARGFIHDVCVKMADFGCRRGKRRPNATGGGHRGEGPATPDEAATGHRQLEAAIFHSAVDAD